jgi:hypothetical protein
VLVPDSAEVVLLMLAERVALLPAKLVSIGFSKRGFRDAIAIGAVLAMTVGVDMA